MATGLINPFGPSGPEGVALLASTAYSGTPQTSKRSTTLINGFASRDLATLPAGPLALALGAEARRERLSYDWDPSLLSGDPFIGSSLRSINGSRSVYALFAELNVPVLRGLAAQLAVRYDDYSDFGSTTNPKVALRWQPLWGATLARIYSAGYVHQDLSTPEVAARDVDGFASWDVQGRYNGFANGRVAAASATCWTPNRLSPLSASRSRSDTTAKRQSTGADLLPRRQLRLQIVAHLAARSSAPLSADSPRFQGSILSKTRRSAIGRSEP